MTAEQKAKALAKDMGFDSVEHIGERSGLQVFDYFNADDPEDSEVGLPSFILANEKQARTTQGDEAFGIIAELLPE